jgi:hypothetical protein
MPLTRTSIVRGPAIVTFGGATFYSKDDIKLTTENETFDIDVSAYGKVDERVNRRKMTVSFTPSGAWAALATLFPYGSTVVGSSVFGTDSPLVIQTLAGTTLTFAAAAVTRMPSLHLSASKTLFGPVEFTCLGRDNTAWSATSSVYTTASNPFSDTSFVESGIITQSYSIAWGSSVPWNSLQTKDGVAVEFELGLDPVETDAEGLVDMTLTRLTAVAKMKPVGLTEAQVLAALGLQGTGAARGRSLNAGGQTLNINGASGQVNIALNGANLKGAEQLFGAKSLRVEQIAFVTTRNFASGVPGPVFTVS